MFSKYRWMFSKDWSKLVQITWFTKDGLKSEYWHKWHAIHIKHTMSQPVHIWFNFSSNFFGLEAGFFGGEASSLPPPSRWNPGLFRHVQDYLGNSDILLRLYEVHYTVNGTTNLESLRTARGLCLLPLSRFLHFHDKTHRMNCTPVLYRWTDSEQWTVHTG